MLDNELFSLRHFFGRRSWRFFISGSLTDDTAIVYGEDLFLKVFELLQLSGQSRGSLLHGIILSRLSVVLHVVSTCNGGLLQLCLRPDRKVGRLNALARSHAVDG